MRHFFLGLSLGVSLLLASTVSNAQSSTTTARTLSYQGILQQNQKLVSGTVRVTMHLYSDAEGTHEIWSDRYEAQVANGVFNIPLGSGTVPLPSASKLDQPLWVGTQIEDAPVMTPIMPLSASPYALAIADASVTASKMATDYVAGISINGQQISGRGERVNIVTDGIESSVDPATSTITLKPSSNVAKGTNGASAQTNSTVLGTLTVTQGTFLNTSSGLTTLGSNSASNPGVLVMYDGASHQVTLQAPASLSANATITLPSTSGALSILPSQSANAGKFLQTNGTALSWQTVGAGVSSVFGRNGDVVAVNGDYGFSQISGTIANSQLPTVDILHGGTGATSASAALDNLLPAQSGNGGKFLQTNGTTSSWQSGGGGGVSTVFGRTGDVVATNGDYSFSQISGTIATSQLPGIDVPHGGTGAATLTGILRGHGTSAVTGGTVDLNSSDVTGILTTTHGGTGNTNAISHFFFAGPDFGVSGTPGFRTIQWDDLPDMGLFIQNAQRFGNVQQSLASINISGSGTFGSTLAATGAINSGSGYQISGSATSGAYLRGNGASFVASALLAGDMSGSLAVANGGTGATTASAGLNNLLPSQSGNSGNVLTTNGSGTVSWVSRWVTVPASSSASGTAGDQAYDGTYLYVCVASSTWERVTLSSW
jgi:hypothetical protein